MLLRATFLQASLLVLLPLVSHPLQVSLLPNTPVPRPSIQSPSESDTPSLNSHYLLPPPHSQPNLTATLSHDGVGVIQAVPFWGNPSHSPYRCPPATHCSTSAWAPMRGWVERCGPVDGHMSVQTGCQCMSGGCTRRAGSMTGSGTWGNSGCSVRRVQGTLHRGADILGVTKRTGGSWERRIKGRRKWNSREQN